MRTAIRKIGNSQGVLIPKPMLAETGLDTDVDISVENGTIVLRPVGNRQPRVGWAEAAREIAAQCADAPVWLEFTYVEDADVVW